MPYSPQDTPAPELIRRLSAELRRKSGELDAVFNLLPIGIGIAEDPECRYIRVNRAFAGQLGIAPAGNASLSAPEHERPPFKVVRDGVEVPPEELPMQYAARHGVEVHDVELDVVHPDGRRVSLYEWAAPIFDEGGNVRGAIGVFMDITERRRVEREQRFLSDASRVLSSSLDYQSTLRGLAQLAVPALGDYCAIDVVQDGDTCARVEFAAADADKRAVAEALRRFPPVLTRDSHAAGVIRTGDAHLALECPSDVLRRAAQSDEHLALMERLGARGFMMVPLRARGRTLGLLTIGSCSPDRRFDERDLRFAQEVAVRAGLALDNALLYRDAQEANRLKEEFLATLSHELRTPLNALLGWTHMLRSPAVEEQTRLRAIESIERNAKAQAVLINDILDVSRVISGKLRLNVQPVDLQAVLLAAIDSVKPAARARDIDIALSFKSISGHAMGDADRLQQVAWNLLSNAVKFTPPGGRVEVGLEQVGSAVQITVTDTGIGIDPAFLPYVFDRFRQADSSSTRTHGGLGLGLAIVRHLVDVHGGTVSADSKGTGRGSRFMVMLPLAPAPRTEAAAGAHQSEGRGVLRGIRVLAVDDDPDSRELILVAVQMAGGEVMAVESGRAALDACGGFDPHVIIADLAMPEMDGYDLLRELTARRGPVPPVIALSAYGGEDAGHRSRAAGFALHLSKPADYEQLVNAVAGIAAK